MGARGVVGFEYGGGGRMGGLTDGPCCSRIAPLFLTHPRKHI